MYYFTLPTIHVTFIVLLLFIGAVLSQKRFRPRGSSWETEKRPILEKPTKIFCWGFEELVPPTHPTIS
jgi:hypothetical protein